MQGDECAVWLGTVMQLLQHVPAWGSLLHSDGCPHQRALCLVEVTAPEAAWPVTVSGCTEQARRVPPGVHLSRAGQ